jgi:O-antigen/teichoic acid export membrane protein
MATENDKTIEKRPGGRRRLLSDHSLTRKASLNAVAAMLDYAARLVVGFVLNPLLVTRLGDAAFGVYQVLGRLIAYGSPAGGRPSQALKWTLAHHQHSTDYEEKRRQVGSAFTVWILFLPLLVAVTAVLAWFAPIWLDVPDDLTTTVRIAAGLLALDLIVTNLVTIPQSVLQGENLGYRRMGMTTLTVIGGGVLTAIVALLGGGLIGVAASVLVTTLVTGATFLWVVRRNVAWFGMVRPPLREITPFVRLSVWFLLWNLVIQLMRGSDVVVLGIAASAEVVTVYVLARYVPEAIFGVAAIVVSAVMPGLGGLVGARDGERAAGVRAESMSATWLIATVCGAVYLLYGEAFLALWVGAEYYPGRTASLLIVVMVLQFALIRNDASIIDLTLELRGKVLLGLVSAGLAIGLGVMLVDIAEQPITGLALGFIAGRALLSITYPWLVSRRLGVSPWRQFLGSVRPGIVTAGLFGAALALEPRATTGSWLVLVLACAALTPAVAFLAYVAGLSRDQRRRLRGRATRLVRAG